MQDSSSVITTAAKGLGERIAEFWECKAARVFEILGKDNPYPKFRRLVRAIAATSKDKADRNYRLSIIKVDLDVFFDDLMSDSGGKTDEVEQCVLCDELYDVMRTKMAKMSKAERLKECREAIAVLQHEVSFLEKLS